MTHFNAWSEGDKVAASESNLPLDLINFGVVLGHLEALRGDLNSNHLGELTGELNGIASDACHSITNTGRRSKLGEEAHGNVGSEGLGGDRVPAL